LSNLRGIHQRGVRTASGSDRILHATQYEHLIRKVLFDPVATARGSDTIRGDHARLDFLRHTLGNSRLTFV